MTPVPQQSTSATTVRYAGLGYRALAVLIDTVAIGGIFVVVLGIAQAAGAVHLAAYRTADPFSVHVPRWAYVALYGLLFGYYTVFELAKSATPGKMALSMRVTTADGATPGASAVVLRNLIRVPEAVFYYIPSAISCLASSRQQRLGDLAAHTVVVRSSAATGAARGAAPPPPSGPSWAPPAGPATALTSSGDEKLQQTLEQALDALKTAGLGVRGAHHNYLRLSEREIGRGGGVTAEFSPEYTAAWHTLADAVITMQQANAEAATAATHAGVSLAQAAGARPDLQYLCRELDPYFGADSDEAVQEAYLRVARQEATGA